MVNTIVILISRFSIEDLLKPNKKYMMWFLMTCLTNKLWGKSGQYFKVLVGNE